MLDVVSKGRRLRERELTVVGEVLHVQHGDLDAFLSEQMHDYLANAIASTGYDHDFLAPDVGVVRPIVCDGIVEPGADFVKQAENEQRLQVLERGCVARSKATAVDCVFACQEQWQSKQWVQRRKLEEPCDSVAGDACIINQPSSGRIACASRTFARQGPFAADGHDGVL